MITVYLVALSVHIYCLQFFDLHPLKHVNLLPICVFCEHARKDFVAHSTVPYTYLTDMKTVPYTYLTNMKKRFSVKI